MKEGNIQKGPPNRGMNRLKSILLISFTMISMVSIANATDVSSSGCDPTLWSHVYGENSALTYRLLANNTFSPNATIGDPSYACIRVTGTVQKISIVDPDGDYHVSLKLDPQYSFLLNQVNLNTSGDLVVEIICSYPSNKSEKACGTFNQSYLFSGLSVGEHAAFIGEYVTDVGGPGWNEMHPLTSISYTGPVTTISSAIPVERGVYNKTVKIQLTATDIYSTINTTQYQSCFNYANFSQYFSCTNVTNYNGNISVSVEGYRTVKYRSIDNAGNIEMWNTVDFTIDKTRPNITAPSDIIVNATGINTAVMLGKPTVSDNLDPNPVVTNNAPVGFPVGTTKVTWTATDFANNSNSSSQNVTVKPAILTLTAIPNTSIGDNNPTTISSNILQANDVLLGILDNDNDTGYNSVLIAYQNVSGIDGMYSSLWNAKIYIMNSSSVSDQITPFNININNTNDTSTYIKGLLNGVTNVYVWVDSKGNIINITDAFSLISGSPTQMIIHDGDTIRFARLIWNGTDFVDNYSNTGFTLFANMSVNPILMAKTVPNGNYSVFAKADAGAGNYNLAFTTVETLYIPPPNSGNNGGGSGGSISSGGSSSGGGSSGGSGGGGGGGVGTAEPYDNILKFESQDDFISTTPVVYRFATVIPVYEVIVTGSQSDEANLRIEILKDTSKLANSSAPGIVYKNFNMWINSKRINNISIEYKVENSWMNNHSLDENDIKLFGWSNGWQSLDTQVIAKDNLYTYFESDSGKLSIFAISGTTKANKVMPPVNVAVERQTPTETTTPNNPVKKSPGFEMAAVIFAVSVIYIMKKRG